MRLDLDSPPFKGPNGEVARADKYAIFYRNGTWPDSVKLGRNKTCDWSSNIPEGFSCGRGIFHPPEEGECGHGFRRFVPVHCSEVVLKVANPRDFYHEIVLSNVNYLKIFADE